MPQPLLTERLTYPIQKLGSFLMVIVQHLFIILPVLRELKI